MRHLLRAIALCAAMLAPVAVQAATLDLTGEAGKTVAATGSYTDAAFGTVTFSAQILGNGSGQLTHEAGSGLGIDCLGYGLACRVDAPDQIDPAEILAVSFSAPKFLTSIDVSQLTSRGYDFGSFSIVLEDMGVVVGSGFVIPFEADDAIGGDLTVAINHWATTVRLVPIAGSYDGFSLAGISIDASAVPSVTPGGPSTPIPEPSSVLMMIIGGAVVLFSIRKVAL
jgi:hypothetical protein